jgi:hypothetical protein
MKIDPKSILVAIPTHDGKIWADCAGGLGHCIAQQKFGNFYFHVQGSCINHIRNQIAGIFMRSQFEWLMCIDSDVGFTAQDWDLFWEGEELIATAEYPKKDGSNLPVTFGMGFVRIHRSVFERLMSLRMDDAGGVIQDPRSDAGHDLVSRYYEKQHIECDFYRTGASSDSRWMAEDFGFWSLVHLAGIKPKIEKRTKLKHWGVKCYEYVADFEREGAN